MYVKLRHPTRTFNFKPQGAVFEVPSEDVAYLVETYGCEIVDPPVEVEIPSIRPDPIIEYLEPEPEPEPEETIEIPLETSPGWFEYGGRKYRRTSLPTEARELLE